MSHRLALTKLHIQAFKQGKFTDKILQSSQSFFLSKVKPWEISSTSTFKITEQFKNNEN